MSARRAGAAIPWFVLPYGAAKGHDKTIKATCLILALRVEAQRRGTVTVTRFTRNNMMNYISERMYECLDCTHPAPLPKWCAILRGVVGNEMLWRSRLITVTRLRSGARHAAQPPSRVELLISPMHLLGGDAVHIKATGRRIIWW